jgi:glycosyltransferase involved in cell wall biosynthesis
MVSLVTTSDCASSRALRVLLCLPPAKVSNEIDLLTGMSQIELLVVAAEQRPEADQSFEITPRRLPYLGSPERWTAALAWLPGLSRLDPGPVDLVISPELNNVGSVQAGRLARRLGVPHVVTIFETLAPYPLFSVPPWRQFSHAVARSATSFLCFTHKARGHAITHGCPSDRCLVVSPGVDILQFAPRMGRGSADPVVIFVGELRRDKGVRTVIAACERLIARGTRLRLVVIGDGQLRREVERHSASASWLEYLGQRPRAEIPQHLGSARVFALAPMRRRLWEEQFGFGYVEAMATALPVVATACGATEEVVPHWNPIVAQGDVDAMANGIAGALGPEGRDWGRRNRQMALQRFDLRRQREVVARTLSNVAADPNSWRVRDRVAP